jgi:hypothetical protein
MHFFEVQYPTAWVPLGSHNVPQAWDLPGGFRSPPMLPSELIDLLTIFPLLAIWHNARRLYQAAIKAVPF